MNLLGLGGLNKDSNGLGEAGADSKATREAVSALRNLTTNNTANCEAVLQADGLGGLIVLLQAGPSHKVATDAAAVLSHIAAVSPTSHDAIREAGGILPLVALLFAAPAISRVLPPEFQQQPVVTTLQRPAVVSYLSYY